MLAYLSRYTHRVAISNSRLIALDEGGVTFRYKDYRRNGHERYRTMTLDPGEFIRRFLLHVLPKGFHRIRHYGLLASAGRKANIARARELLAAPQPEVECGDTDDADAAAPTDWRPPCPCCGGRMIIVETFERGSHARAPPSSGFASRTANVMTANRPSRTIPAERPHRRRKANSFACAQRRNAPHQNRPPSNDHAADARHRRGSLARQRDHCHPPAASVRPSSTQRKPQIPIDRNRALAIPRVLSLEAFGTPAQRQANMWMAGIRNPSQYRTLRPLPKFAASQIVRMRSTTGNGGGKSFT